MKNVLRSRRLKRLFILLLVVTTSAFIALISCNYSVKSYSRPFTYSDNSLIPYNKAGLVLGTSKYLANGQLNPYFENRIAAAAALYHAGKISYLIVSGDNSVATYNEPQMMREALGERGVPSSVVFDDYAGFRTFDSVVRAKEIFGQASVTIISQEFHNERAIYIARHKGLNAIGFNAADVDSYQGLKTNARELAARVKMFIDVFVFPAHPHFLGDRINLEA